MLCGYFAILFTFSYITQNGVYSSLTQKLIQKQCHLFHKYFSTCWLTQECTHSIQNQLFDISQQDYENCFNYYKCDIV